MHCLQELLPATSDVAGARDRTCDLLIHNDLSPCFLEEKVPRATSADLPQAPVMFTLYQTKHCGIAPKQDLHRLHLSADL